MRRRPGVHGIQRNTAARDAYKAAGDHAKEVKLATMQDQMAQFKSSLETFALKHRKEIRSNPTFRAQFQTMCANIGVDPLASNKGMWSQMLGLGDFYYKLGVQVVEACLVSRDLNGGMMEMSRLVAHVQRRRGEAADAVSADDVVRAIKKLRVLGEGFSIEEVAGKRFVRSLPGELSLDKNKALAAAEAQGHLTVKGLTERNRWDEQRAASTLWELTKEGLSMVDDGSGQGATLYWFPCFADKAGDWS